MIQFSFIIKRWAVFYFFIQNLSEWHFSNRKEYNKLWKSKLGPFSKKEKDALKNFNRIHKKYSFGEMYIGRQFFLNKNPWEPLNKKMPEKDFSEVKKVFDLFKEKFNYFYEKEHLLLEKWKEKLNKEIIKKESKEINQYLSLLYKNELLEENINVYLLPSTKKYTGGLGGSINEKSITLEISRYPLEKINHAIGIIWHELIHLHYERKYLNSILKKKYPKNKKKISKIKELIASSLLPNGVLGDKFLGNKSTILNLRIPKEHTKKIKSLTQKYIQEKNLLTKTT